MSTKEKSTKAESTTKEIQYNPHDYGYRNTEKMVFSPRAYFTMVEFLNGLIQKNTKPVVEFDEQGNVGAQKTVVIGEGVEANYLMQIIEEQHIENIKEGRATHVDVLTKEAEENAPKVESVTQK